MAKRTWTLIDAEQNVEGPLPLELEAPDLKGVAESIRVRAQRHQAGRSRDVISIRLDNGSWEVTVIPTRGMSVWKARCGDVVLGWESPVRGPVHPIYVPLAEPSGLGWLDGFDELLVRCGLASNGAPDFDEQGRLLYPLHGRIGNTPAHRVTLSIDERTGELELIGEVDETRFHFLKVRLTTTLRMRVGQTALQVEDRVTNLSASPADIQLLYHVNFGRPLLDSGAHVWVPATKVVPRNARAAEGIESWNHYPAEQPGFEEQVYFCQLQSAADGRSEVLLHNAHGTQGISLQFDIHQLPFFTLWKNATAHQDGYVTGLEPGTNFPNPRTFEGQQGRVVHLPGGAHAQFDLQVAYHPHAQAVEECRHKVQSLMTRPSQILDQPQADWCVL